MTPITWDKREHGWFIGSDGRETFGPLPDQKPSLRVVQNEQREKEQTQPPVTQA